jgi:hypothetical protein
MDVNGTPGTVVDMGSRILPANRTLHSALKLATAVSHQLILTARIETMINRTTRAMVN